MPTIALSPVYVGAALELDPAHGPPRVERAQLRCLVRLPGFVMPKDAVIDTGAPFTCFPRSLWDRFTEGTDFEWVPFAPAYQPPVAVMAGWRYSFRLARFRAPLVLLDSATEVERADVIAQFADSDRPGRTTPLVIVGLWGGLLEGAAVRVTRDPATGSVIGALELP